MCVCVVERGRGVPPSLWLWWPVAPFRWWEGLGFFFFFSPSVLAGQLPRSVGPCVIFDLFPAVRACR
jgi:hypothetical protein